MADESRLEELLSRWHSLQTQQFAVSPAELCRDCPELLPELERRIKVVKHMNQLVQGQTPVDAGAEGSCSGENSTGSHHATPGQEAPTLPPSTAPRLLGRYRVESLLGRGGFGEVWKAYDPLLQRLVAIKTPRPDRLLPAGWVDATVAEARRPAALDHPNIVPVYDVVQEGGAVFIVSALIDGKNLSQYVAGRRLPVQQSLPIVIGVALGLHRAHLHGLVHRDVKPGNILVDRHGHPYLTDFGLAVSEEEMLQEQPAILGTLAYMSPEQIRGDSHLVDARSDIYSLGVILYELLTGRLPLKATKLSEYQEQILGRAARPPRTIDDTIDPELERICLKCLARSVQDRYTTAADLAQDLRRWLARQVEETKPGRARPRWVWVLALVGAVCLGLAFLFASQPWKGPPSEEPRSGEAQPQALPERAALKRGPASPQPGVWNNLLDRELDLLIRPMRFAQQFDPEKKELWWDSQGDCLMRLGTTQNKDYEVEATLEQSALAGHRGLFVGLPPAPANKPIATECQAILVVPVLRQNMIPDIFRARMVVQLASRRVQLGLLSGPLPLSLRSRARFTLSVRVKKGRLSSVCVDHVEVKGLVPAPAEQTPPLVGAFGVFTDMDSTRLTRARWKIHHKEN